MAYGCNSITMQSDLLRNVMKLRVNNKIVDLEGNTIEELLQKNNLWEKKGLAVAVNETVVPKSEWGIYELSENDSLVIIKPAQGG